MYIYIGLLVLGVFVYKYPPTCKKQKKTKLTKLDIVNIACKLILQSIYLKYQQMMNRHVKYIKEKDVYEISYRIKNNLYKFRTKQKKGPSKILLISDENDDDITEQMIPYLGPQSDFHNIKYTPYDFNKKKLEIYTVSGGVLIFNNDENIKIE